MATIVLWRHGRTAWNAGHRFQGHVDIPLDDTGREQARTSAAGIANLGVTHIVSSDLGRAAETAAALAALTGLPVAVDAGLREASAGSWEGLTHDEIRAADGPRFAAWRSDGTIKPGGHGESRADVGTRMRQTLSARTRAAGGDCVVVACTHGGSARAAIGSLLELPLPSWSRLRVLDNGAWAVLATRADGSWSLVGYNVCVRA